MTTSIDDNRASREAVLARVRKALGKTGPDAQRAAEAKAYIAAHRQGRGRRCRPISSRAS